MKYVALFKETNTIFSYVYDYSTGKLWCAKKNKKKRKKVLYNANKNDGEFQVAGFISERDPIFNTSKKLN